MAIPNHKNASDLGQQAIALAEQLGRIAGTLEGTAEAWLNRQTLTDQLTRVRDGATEMLDTLTSGTKKTRKTAAGTVGSFAQNVRRTASASVAMAAAAAGVGRAAQKNRKKKKTAKGAASATTRGADPAHAPGKQRRKPGPTLHGVKKSDEQIPKLRTAAFNRQRRKT